MFKIKLLNIKQVVNFKTISSYFTTLQSSKIYIAKIFSFINKLKNKKQHIYSFKNLKEEIKHDVVYVI